MSAFRGQGFRQVVDAHRSRRTASAGSPWSPRSSGRFRRRSRSSSAIAAPSNSGVGIRTVEWLRDHGARGLVNQVENIYYSLNAPSTGGPGLKALPASGGHRAGPEPARAAPSRLSAARDRAGDVPRPPRRGPVARDVRARRRPAAGARDELPPGPELSASRRRRRVDRSHADDDVAVSRAPGAGRQPPVPGADGGA